MESFKKGTRKMLSNNVKSRIAFTGKKIGAFFQNKDRTEKRHNHDIVYYNKCPKEQYKANYIGKTGRRIIKRIINHAGRYSESYAYKRCIETRHRCPDINKIVGSNFWKNLFKRKIGETLLITQLQSTLNKQEKLVELKLFN